MMNNVDRVIETAVGAGAALAAQPAQEEVWIVVKEHTWDHEDGDAPTLAYLWPYEFERKTYPSFEAASQFIREGDWPLGWVAMRVATAPAPNAQQKIENTCTERSVRMRTDLDSYQSRVIAAVTEAATKTHMNIHMLAEVRQAILNVNLGDFDD